MIFNVRCLLNAQITSMDIKKLKYFMAVAEELSFSKAARRLGVGQPTLSRAIKDLEETIGSTLFLREATPIKLTPSAETLLPKIDEALMVLEEGIEAVRKIEAAGETVLDVGYLPSAYESFVGDALTTFCQAMPEVRLNPQPQDPGPMVEDLRSGKLDIAFIGHICPELEREFDPFFIWKIPLCVVVAEHHPLAEPTTVRLEEFADYPLISLNAEKFPGRHELITNLCRKAGIKPKSTQRVDGLLGALANIAGSNAFTIMPREVEKIATKHVRFLELVHPKAGVDFHALVQKGESRKIVLTLLNECRRIVNSRFP